MEPWMFWTGLISSVILNIAVLTFVAFFKSYGARKGENLATHEDIQKLVDQVKAVTTATEEIKAKISDQVLTRQRHRELKREAMFTAVKELAHLQEFLSIFLIIGYVDKNDPRHVGLYDRYEASKIALRNARYLSMIVCEKRVVDILEEVSFLVELAFQESANNKGSAQEKAKKAEALISSLLEEMRKELEMN